VNSWLDSIHYTKMNGNELNNSAVKVYKT